MTVTGRVRRLALLAAFLLGALVFAWVTIAYKTVDEHQRFLARLGHSTGIV